MSREDLRKKLIAMGWLEGIIKSVADAMVNDAVPPEERVSMKAVTGVYGPWGDK